MQSFEEIANSRDHVVKILHVPTNIEVSFPAFIKSFSDNINVDWQGETAYGRTDEIMNYRSTKRSITISFDVVASSLEKAKENMAKFNTLQKMLYPVYSQPLNLTQGNIGPGSTGRTIVAPPLTRVKFINYIQNVGTNPEEGLLGCITGIKFDPQIERVGTFIDEQNNLLPKVFNIAFDFKPQHEQTLGWQADGSFISEKFPYDLNRGRTIGSRSSQTNEDVRRAEADRILGVE
tara:strand:- start:462 stop:1163 length:702 start_codon:yes stop_codon:yes gene_type:complete